jgi:ABC-type nickel/cobalt efflux system permease component RcnA
MPSVSRRWLRWAVVVAALGIAIPLLAHPMGNFSVNHYSGIFLSREFLQLHYIIDMAEIPTFQEMQATGIKADPQDPHISQYLRAKEAEFTRGLTLRVDEKPVLLSCNDRQVIFPPGAGGLPTMKLGFTCRAAVARLPAGAHRVEYRDDNFSGRAGWKEIVVNADPELNLATSAPSRDRSSELSNYPTDLLNSPPQDVAASASFVMPELLSARKTVRSSPPTIKALAKTVVATPPTDAPAKVAAPAASATGTKLAPNAQGTPRNAFTQLMASPRFSLWFLLTAALIAAGLGALHALEPGHGKTLVAAYLAGSRGTAWHAVLLGVIVTLSHTASVYVLGGITLYASRYIVPDRLYPWLGAFSGLIIAAFGVMLFLRRWSGQDAPLTEGHTHWHDRFLGQVSGSGHAASAPTLGREPLPLRQLFILGITGGLVPCPAALVVLLSAVALHRIAFGFFLILAFSFGLAAVLIAIGLLIVQAGRLVSGFNSESPLIRQRLPQVSAILISIVGIGIAVQSLQTAGLRLQWSAFSSPKWLLVAGIGLLLGMRHSTDPDHVIAVTTIVTRQRSLRQASVIGMLWGVGHTLTIFLVGSAIILFNIVIPPRIGLSMEFAVALMLILLGILNLTGVLAWITRRFTPAGNPEESLPAANPSSTSERWLDRALTRFGAYQLLRPLAIGLVHGLAGSAAVALLVLATIHSPLWAIGYLLLFGGGTILGMMIMTAAIAVPVVWTGKNFVRLNRYMCTMSGIVSLAFGCFLVYQIGFVSGLFRAVPNWIPS